MANIFTNKRWAMVLLLVILAPPPSFGAEVESRADEEDAVHSFAVRRFSVNELWRSFRQWRRRCVSEEGSSQKKKKVRFASSSNDIAYDHMIVRLVNAGFVLEKQPGSSAASNTTETTSEGGATSDTEEIFFDARSCGLDASSDKASDTTLEARDHPLPCAKGGREGVELTRERDGTCGAVCGTTPLQAQVCLMRHTRHKRPFSYLLTPRDDLRLGEEAVTYDPHPHRPPSGV